jgi:hypothetical protein
MSPELAGTAGFHVAMIRWSLKDLRIPSIQNETETGITAPTVLSAFAGWRRNSTREVDIRGRPLVIGAGVADISDFLSTLPNAPAALLARISSTLHDIDTAAPLHILVRYVDSSVISSSDRLGGVSFFCKEMIVSCSSSMVVFCAMLIRSSTTNNNTVHIDSVGTPTIRHHNANVWVAAENLREGQKIWRIQRPILQIH